MKNLITLPKIILSLAFLILVILISYKVVETSKINIEPKTLYGFSKLKIQSDTMRSNLIKNSYIKLYDEYNQVAKTANGLIDTVIGAIKNNSSKQEIKFIYNLYNNDLKPKIQSLLKKINDSSHILSFGDIKVYLINIDIGPLLDYLSKDKNIDTKNYFIKKLSHYRWQLIEMATN